MAAIGQTRAAFPAPAPQSKVRTPLFIFGVALALVAFLVMFAIGIVYVGRSQPTGTVPVVVAKNNIDARMLITPDMLTLSPIPASAVPAHSYLHIADLKGMSALVPIYKGAPISDNLVSADEILSQHSIPIPVPDGWVAMTLPTGEQQGVAGYIAQTDEIQIVATAELSQFGGSSKRGTAAVTVYPNVYVLKVGPQSFAPKAGQGLTSSITVAVMPCDVPYMAWLLQNATVKYTLISHKNFVPFPPATNPTCPSTTEPGVIGAPEVEARWHFTKA